MKRVTLDLGAEIARPLSSAHSPTRSACMERCLAAVGILEEEQESVKSSAYEVVKTSD